MALTNMTPSSKRRYTEALAVTCTKEEQAWVKLFCKTHGLNFSQIVRYAVGMLALDPDAVATAAKHREANEAALEAMDRDLAAYAASQPQPDAKPW